jgi:hypothetical protein
MLDNKMFVMFFNGSDGIIHLEAPPNKDASAEVIAEQYKFLKSIAGLLARFSEDVVAAGKDSDIAPKDL